MTNIAIDFQHLVTSPFSINSLLIKLEVVEKKSRIEIVVHAPHTLSS